MAIHTSPHFPNGSSVIFPTTNWPEDCSHGCLYDIINDPNEHDDLW